MTQLNVLNFLPLPRIVFAALTALTLTMSGCQSDSTSRNDADPVNNPVNGGASNGDSGTTTPDGGSESGTDAAGGGSGASPVVDTGGADGTAQGNGQSNAPTYEIALSATQFSLIEGRTIANVDITISRQNGHSDPISLALDGVIPTDARAFTDEVIDSNENSSNLQIQIGVSRAPILAQQRVINLVATDGNGSPVTTPITLNITPTDEPDVYLLIGQSNMVGASEFGAREDGPGGADATNRRILQLNVTGNDETNHDSVEAFTDPAAFANTEVPIVEALDPLHDGFDFSRDGKEGTQIGLGLNFAKNMLASTTAEVVLVPAAWSDTGFCNTTSSRLFDTPGLGWNARAQSNTTDFAGTLLYERALARLNYTLEITGGIFRGILWHQGEADAPESVCAEAYQTNLQNLVSALRANARVDSRGDGARSVSADIPFIAGTLSRGDDGESNFNEISPSRQLVENAHRGVAGSIQTADTVIFDDLRPMNNFPCGNGGCIHFGSQAYRIMGARYAERMGAVQRQQ